RLRALLFVFFQAEDGIRDFHVTEFRRVLFRSVQPLHHLPALRYQRRPSPEPAPATTPAATAFVAPLQTGAPSQLPGVAQQLRVEIGRASCRERGGVAGGAATWRRQRDRGAPA